MPSLSHNTKTIKRTFKVNFLTSPLAHKATLIFCSIDVIAPVRIVIPNLAHLILPTWTYCFDGKPFLQVSRPMMPFLKEEDYIVKKEGVEGQASVGVS